VCLGISPYFGLAIPVELKPSPFQVGYMTLILCKRSRFRIARRWSIERLTHSAHTLFFVEVWEGTRVRKLFLKVQKTTAAAESQTVYKRTEHCKQTHSANALSSVSNSFTNVETLLPHCVRDRTSVVAGEKRRKPDRARTNPCRCFSGDSGSTRLLFIPTLRG